MKYVCPVCGYPELDEPPYDEKGNGSYDICPSCGYEFGVTDADRGISIQEWRKQWIAGGMQWHIKDPIHEENKPPSNWNPTEQLKNTPREYQ